MQFGDLGARLDAQLGVEVRQRLVHQENLRAAHHGARERDALALTAGELRRLALEQMPDRQRARPPRRRASIVRARLAAPGTKRPTSGRRCQRSCGASPAAARRSRPPSCTDRARRTGTPSPRRAASAAARRRCGRRSCTSPLSCGSSPAMMRSSVVLPQPDGPTRVRNSPSSMSSDTPLSTAVSRKLLVTSAYRDPCHGASAVPNAAQHRSASMTAV